MQLSAKVTVKPLRLDPVVQKSIDKIKYVINMDGYFSAKEFKELVEETKVNELELLTTLQQEGILHVKTFLASIDAEQEVLVDVRLMAAAMLLIYSDGSFALKNSVYKFVEALYAVVGSSEVYVVLLLNPLLRNMYEAYGHHFTISKIAEAADLSEQDESYIVKRAHRHANTLRELIKSDTELTAVYNLTIRTMDIVNGNWINERKANRSDLQYRHFHKPISYNRFWTIAQKIINQHYKK